MRFFYYCNYIFFSAYWLAYYFGNKKDPENNAEYLLSILLSLNFFGCLQLLKLKGISVNAIFIGVIFLLSYFLVHRVFLDKERFKNNLKRFSFLKEKQFANKRLVLIVSISIWTFLFVAFADIITSDIYKN